MKRFLLLVLIIGFATSLITSCEYVKDKPKRKEKFELEKKQKIISEYNSSQLSKLKQRWIKHKQWNKNEGWVELLARPNRTYDLQQSFKDNKIGLDTVVIKDMFMVDDTSDAADSNVDKKWRKYIIGYKSKYIVTCRSSSRKYEFDDRFVLHYELSVDEDIFIKLSKEDADWDNRQGLEIYIVFESNNFILPKTILSDYTEDIMDEVGLLQYTLVLEGRLLDYYIPKSNLPKTPVSF